jgi:hypothetical protein
VDVTTLGAKGDGMADDTIPITKALNSSAQSILLPPGIYKISDGITIPAGKSLKGYGSNNTKIHYYKEGGTAITLKSGGELSRLRIESKGNSQNGVYLEGIGPVLNDVEIDEFQNIALQLGKAGTTGCYFARVDNVNITNRKNQGIRGVLIDGQTIPSSNANSLKNVFVKGRFSTLVNIRGNNNTWFGGDTEWNASGTGVDDVWLIEGNGNVIIAPYMESGSGTPRRIFAFSSKANSNTMRDVYAQFQVQNIYSKTVDDGNSNKIDFASNIYGLPNSGITNLIPNSHFRNWNGDNPEGWLIKNGKCSQESAIVKGGAYSLKITALSDNPVINCYIAGHKTSISGLPIERFKGKTVTAGIWVKTNIAGMGNIKILVDGTGGGSLGNNKHTGDNTWQFLTAIAKVPSNATYLAIQLKGLESGTGEGEEYYSEPILIEGNHLLNPTPAFLNDSYSKMSGAFVYNYPITFGDGDSSPSVKDGNIFRTANSLATMIKGFNDGIAGQQITIIFADGHTTINFSKSNMKGNHGINWSPKNGDHMTCIYDGINWYCDISINTS